VGAIDAGKTTLISLLLWFYDVTGGRILIDGADLRELAMEDLRSPAGHAGASRGGDSHSFSTIQDMDRILVFHKGELRESGTHGELMSQTGSYYRLRQLQN
jgi:ABC-type multidrug transport system fused ATPase/permease subunit